MDCHSLKAVAALATELLRHFRAKRVSKAKMVRAVLLKYVAMCGGWMRAFPTSLNGDVAKPFRFNLDEQADCWIIEHMRFWRECAHGTSDDN